MPTETFADLFSEIRHQNQIIQKLFKLQELKPTAEKFPTASQMEKLFKKGGLQEFIPQTLKELDQNTDNLNTLLEQIESKPKVTTPKSIPVKKKAIKRK